MTRTAPLMTLLAVAALGGGLFATNHLSTPAPTAVPVAANAAAPAPAAPVTGTVPEPAAPAPEPQVEEAEAAAEEVAPAPDEAAYAGRTEGRDMTVAVVVTGDDAVAYVCDSDDEVWLRGTVTDGELTMENTAGTATLSGTVDADGAAGTVTVGDDEYAFTAEATDIDEAVAGGREDVADVADRAGMDY
ncbi:hypothetical protein [Pseudonocardia broussonetiae]|uniref:DUF5666 domain-containing protein n=1 Tax=Pseudonocardia broussonetiae TaxID=2736640 RepID=A0A6M6JP81_9PSEU|nr:hypothetical protein [Pseudonocardia broussonetiae]QJY48757.1 hypothetical protein HOP40_25715 [Pseudonocardia broussonetiae]